MTWPPTAEEWRDILCELPDAADGRAVQAAVEAAVREYLNRAPHDEAEHFVRKELGKEGKVVLKKLRDCVGRLDQLSAGEFEAVRAHIEALTQSLTPEQLNATFYLPSKRRERLLTWISLAWTGPGTGTFAISTGPLARFLSAIMDYVPGERPLTERGAKAFLARNFKRRERLRFLGLPVSLIIDESKILLIDAEGNIIRNR